RVDRDDPGDDAAVRDDAARADPVAERVRRGRARARAARAGRRGQPVKHPLLYQVNTRIFLQERGVAINRAATLDDVPDAFLDDVAARGFEWIWWLGVWQTGRFGREISLSDTKLRGELQGELPDLRDRDITGSPFAITAYRVHEDFGGEEPLRRLR